MLVAIYDAAGNQYATWPYHDVVFPTYLTGMPADQLLVVNRGRAYQDSEDGEAWIMVDAGTWCGLNLRGEEVFATQATLLLNFAGGLAPAYFGQLYENGQPYEDCCWKYLDQQGQVAIAGPFEAAEPFQYVYETDVSGYGTYPED